jgi:hypothetical protein
MLCEPHALGLGAFVARLAVPLTTATATSLGVLLAVAKLGGRAPDRAFAVSLAALIGLFLYPAVVIVPAWLVGAVDSETGRSLARTAKKSLSPVGEGG